MADNEYLDLIGGPAPQVAQPTPAVQSGNEYLDLIDTNVVALPRAQAGARKKPDSAGQAVQLSQTTGFPASVIGADLQQYQQIDKGQKAAAAIERNQWISGYIARNLAAAEVSNDDYDNLDNLSKVARNLDPIKALKEHWWTYPIAVQQEVGEAMGRGFKQGFGEQPIGFSTENRKNYPLTTLTWQPFVAPVDTFLRSVGGVVGAAGAGIAELYRKAGGSEADVNRLDRDLRVIGMGALLEMGQVRAEPGAPKPGTKAPGGYVSLDDFFATLRGMDTRKQIDEFLAKRDGGPNDILRIEFQKERVATDSAKLDEAVQAAGETNTKARAPTLLDDFVKGHEDGALMIPAETIAAVYQEAGKVPASGDGLFGFVPDLAQKLSVGSQTGTAIDIPTSSYLAHIDPTVHEKIKESIRFSNDGMTLGEAKEAKPETNALSIKEEGDINFNTKIGAPSLFRGTEAGVTSETGLRVFEGGDIGNGIYLTGSKEIASSYGGGPKASIEAGTRTVHEYELAKQYPEETAFVFGGAKVGDPVRIVSGNGIELWKGEWSSKAVEKALAQHPDIKVVFGTPNSIGRNQIAVRDRSILSPKTKDTVVQQAVLEADELGLKPLFAEPLPGMTKTDFERYNKKVLAAQQKTLDKATEVQTREAAKRQGEEWKANEAALRPEVEAQVKAFPDIAADRFLRSGELPDGSTAPKVRLDDAYVRALLDKTEIPEIMLAKDGIHPDDIAPLFGFNSGAAMVRALNDLATERKTSKLSPTQHLNDLVKRELASQMEAKYGNLEASISAEARALALDDLHFDILADELRALATEVGTSPPYTKDQIKALAAETFARLDSKQAANFEKFQKTAGRNGLLAERALLKGDAVEAFNAKQVQAFQFLLAKEAERFGKLVDRMAKKIDRVTKNDEIKSMDQEHFDQLKRVLGELGFDLRGSDPNPTTSLGDFVAQSDGQLAVAAWLTDGTLLPRDPGALTAQQMRDLAKTIDSMMHVGRQAKTLNSVHGRAELDNVVFDIVKQLERFDFINQPQHPSKYQMVKKALKHVAAWNLLVERMLDYTDKFDPSGPITTYLDRPLRDSYSHEIELNETVTKKLRELQKYTDASINDVIPNNVIPTKRLANSLLDMNRGNLRQLMGYMGSESGIKKVTRGFGVDEADVWKLINDNATKADWQWVAGMHDLYETLWKESSAMQERVTGVAADAIQPRTMKSDKFGDFPGGYWPLKYDPFDSNIAGDLALKGKLFEPTYVPAVTPHAYTMPRTNYAGALDLTGVLGASHLKGIIHDIAFREAILNANKLISNKSFKDAMNQRWGQEYASLLPGWLRDIANAQRVDDSYAQGAIRTLSLIRQNVISTLIAFNPGTFIKHGGTALGMSVASVGAKGFVGSAWDFGLRGMIGAAKDIVAGQKERVSIPEELTDALKAVTDPTEYGDGVRQFILDSSPLMRNRQRQAQDNVREAYQANIRFGAKQTYMDLRGVMMDIGRVPIAASDAISAFPTWLASYREVMTRTGDHAQSVFEADRQVARSHGSNFIGDKPLSLRIGGNTVGGEVLRTVTSLYGFFNHNFNMALQWAWDAGARWKGANEPGANIKSLSNKMFWGFIMAVAMEELAAPALDEHKQGIATRIALAGIRHMGAWIPGLRDFTNALAGGYEPSVGVLGTIYKNVYNTSRDMKKASKDWLIHVVTSIGFATGMVGTQYGRTGSYLKDRMTGQERTPRTWNELRQGLRTGHSKPRIMQ